MRTVQDINKGQPSAGGWAQFQAYRRLGVPLSLVSHWRGLERNGDTSYAVPELLLRRIQQSGQAE